MVSQALVDTGLDAERLRAGDRSEVSPEELIRDLKSARVVFVGELHDLDDLIRTYLLKAANAQSAPMRLAAASDLSARMVVSLGDNSVSCRSAIACQAK